MPGNRQSQSESMSQPSSLKKSSSLNQKTLASFFQKKPVDVSQAKVPPTKLGSTADSGYTALSGSSSSLTPAPSSDAIEQNSSPVREALDAAQKPNTQNIGLPSPVTPIIHGDTKNKPKTNEAKLTLNFDSPSRKVAMLPLYFLSGCKCLTD